MIVIWDNGPVRKFPSGQIVATPEALEALTRAGDDPRAFLCRHFAGDWGDVCDSDKQANEGALRDAERLLSSYRTSLDEEVWIITEADRSATTILLPSDY
jgi:hypothetical protein